MVSRVLIGLWVLSAPAGSGDGPPRPAAAAPVAPAVSTAAPVDPRAAADNRRGMAKYRAGDYAGAAELFKRAIATQPNHLLANYNLACVMALAYEPRGDPCLDEDGLAGIAQQLRRAIAIDASLAAKARVDSDFASVRDSLEFLRAVGETFSDAASVERAIAAVGVWMKPAVGVEPTPSLSLENGHVELVERGWDAEGLPKPEVTRTGRYVVNDDGTVRVRFDDGGALELRLRPSGSIEVSGVVFTPGVACGV